MFQFGSGYDSGTWWRPQYIKQKIYGTSLLSCANHWTRIYWLHRHGLLVKNIGIMKDLLWGGHQPTYQGRWKCKKVHVYLLFYILATSNVISGWVLTCSSAHSWRLYSAVPLGNQAARTMIWYPPQSHYPDTWTKYSLPYPNNTKRLARKPINIKVFCLAGPGFEHVRFGFPDLPKREEDALLIRPSRLVTCRLRIKNAVYLHWTLCRVKQHCFVTYFLLLTCVSRCRITTSKKMEIRES